MNSSSFRLLPPKVIVCAAEEVKSTSPVPLSQTVVSVEAFVQRPVIVQVSEPKVMPEDALLMLTPPVMLPVPEVEVMSPPDMVKPSVADWLLLTVRANVLLARVPPEMVRVLSTTTALPNVIVPPDTVTVVKVLSVDNKVTVAVVSKVYVEVVPSLKTELAPDVFQLPETVQPPVVTVIVPLVPPVMVTVDSTTVEALAVSVPALPTLRSGVSAELPIARSVVARAVVEDESVIDIVVSQRKPLVAILKVNAAVRVELKVTLLNSASARLAPA